MQTKTLLKLLETSLKKLIGVTVQDSLYEAAFLLVSLKEKLQKHSLEFVLSSTKCLGLLIVINIPI